MDQRDPRTGKEHREFFNIDLSSGWETIAPGIEAKTLAGSLDEAAGKGHLNRLARWAPNAEIDAVRAHEFYEEGVVIRGTLLVASQQPPHRLEAFHAPAFACRPPHAKHGPSRQVRKAVCCLRHRFSTRRYPQIDPTARRIPRRRRIEIQAGAERWSLRASPTTQ